MKYWWWVVVLVVGCISPVMHFGDGKSKTQAQHDTLNEFRPAHLSFEKRWTGPVTDARIRVYADDEYRTQNRAWREAFDERLDYANAVLGATFGVHLVADYREWNHHTPGATLADHIEQLEQLDPGTDVLTVIGLTSSLSLASATFDQLGLATLSGRHMMLRGYADIEERKMVQNAFADLSADEREDALQSMRIHKNAAVFLHELGHNLGADHEDVADTLMNPSYARNAKGFSAEAEAAILRTLDQRLGRARSAVPVNVAPAAPAPRPKHHPTMHVVVTDKGAIVDGAEHENGELDMVFSAQAALDNETAVVISKRREVPSQTLADVVHRLTAAGLDNISFE